MSENIKKIAFIGNGNMCVPMAHRLIEAGYDVEPVDPTVDGMLAVSEAVNKAAVIVTYFEMPNLIEDTYLGTNGILASKISEKVIVDFSTSYPQLAVDIKTAAEISDAVAFDAPITGSVKLASAGKLTMTIGATEEIAAPIREVLNVLAQEIFFFDKPGLGQKAKLANQIAYATSVMAMAEAFSFAKQEALDAETLLKVMRSTEADSSVLGFVARSAIDGSYKDGYAVENLVRDLGLALEIAENAELTLPGAEAAFQLFALLQEIGGARFGTQSIALLYDDEQACAAAGLDWSLMGEEYDEPEEDDHSHHAHDDFFGFSQN